MFSNSSGCYTGAEKRMVWNRGETISGYSSDTWRRDKYGRAIKWDDYGNRNSDYGWEIDHIYPESKGGSDRLSNLQPLHWKSNLKKSDNVA